MKKLIVTDPVQICGSDLIGSDIRNFGWEARMYGIWQEHRVFMELIDSYPSLLDHLTNGEEEDVIHVGELVGF